jgi:hypothetical protein
MGVDLEKFYHLTHDPKPVEKTPAAGKINPQLAKIDSSPATTKCGV